MENNKFHIIVVDDTMGEKDPFVVELKLEYQEEAEHEKDIDLYAYHDNRFIRCGRMRGKRFRRPLLRKYQNG